MSTLANGGTRQVPRLVKAVDEGKGWQDVPPPPNPFKPFLFKPDTIQAIHDGLWLAVNGAGTAGRARIDGPRRRGQDRHRAGDFAAGQGARAAGSDKDLRDHGWFVFMVPRDNPELAGVVFAEHSEHGYLGGADRQTRDRNLLRGEGRSTAADAEAADAPAPPRRRRAARRARRPASARRSRRRSAAADGGGR